MSALTMSASTKLSRSGYWIACRVLRIRSTGRSNAPIDAQSPPSLWPDSLRAEAAAVTERVIVAWRREVESSGRRFLVAYIPRTVAVKDPAAPPDDWRAWLHDVCARDSVALVDPTDRLVQVQQAGRDVFFDHFTDAGHEAFAEALLAWFQSSH